jgi:hypothetical protein
MMPHSFWKLPAMSEKTRRGQRLALLMLAGWLAAGGVAAQSDRQRRGGPGEAPPRQFADPDRAASAARTATGGRVLGVQDAERNGRRGYRVRILEPGGRVRNFDYDPHGNGD